MALGDTRKIYKHGEGGNSPTLWDHAWHDVDLEYELGRFRLGRDAVVRMIAEALPAGARVLEAGCGSGRVLAYLREMGCQAIGVDFASDALSEARKRIPLPMIAADVLRLPFDDATFDAVVSLGLVEHFESGPIDTLHEHARVLRPSGKLLITVPRMNPLKRWSDRRLWGELRPSYQSWRGMEIERTFEPMPGPAPRGTSFYQYEFPDQTLLKFMRMAGFRPTRVVPTSTSLGFRELEPVRRIYGRVQPRGASEDPRSRKPASVATGASLKEKARAFVVDERASGPLGHYALFWARRIAGHVLFVECKRT